MAALKLKFDLRSNKLLPSILGMIRIQCETNYNTTGLFQKSLHTFVTQFLKGYCKSIGRPLNKLQNHNRKPEIDTTALK